MKSPHEIDLLEVSQVIWRGKYLILAITVGVSFAAVSLFHSLPKSVTAELPLLPVPRQEMIGYQTYNAIAAEPIVADSLLSAFREDIRHINILYQAAKNANLFTERSSEKERDVDLRYYNFANRVKLLAPDEGQQEFFSKLVFEVKNEDEGYEFAGELINAANANVQGELRARLDSSFAVEIEKRRVQILDLENEADRLELDYQDSVDHRIAFLEEQAGIARALGLDNPALNTTDFSKVISVVTNQESESAFYLRGYLAIEKEMSLINSRSDASKHIPQLKEIYADIRRLKDLSTIERQREYLRATPLYSSNFMVTATNPLQLKFKSNNLSFSRLLAFAAIVGGFLGIVITVLRNALDAQKLPGNLSQIDSD